MFICISNSTITKIYGNYGANHLFSSLSNPLEGTKRTPITSFSVQFSERFFRKLFHFLYSTN